MNILSNSSLYSILFRFQIVILNLVKTINKILLYIMVKELIGISDKVRNKETIREELRKPYINSNNEMRCLSASWVIEHCKIVK